MRKNCSSDREKLLRFEGEGREFAKMLSSLELLIYSNSERSEQFMEQNAFLTCSWRLLRSNTLESKLEKIIGT